MIIKVSNKQYHNLWELANNFEYPHHWEAWIAYQVIQILAGKHSNTTVRNYLQLNKEVTK